MTKHKDIRITKKDLEQIKHCLFVDLAAVNWGMLHVEWRGEYTNQEPTGRLIAHTPSKEYLRRVREAKRPCDKIACFANEIGGVLYSDWNKEIVYEHLSYGNNRGKDTLIGCQGALIGCYAEASEFTPVHSSTAKKAVTGNGRASKPETHSYLDKHYEHWYSKTIGEITPDIKDCLAMLIWKVKKNRGLV